jgi:membrane associated rhomboid family serine protease
MAEPDLFVVCKNCSSEVSPYVTECPYCGQRVRKRAPKLDREAPAEVKARRRRMPSLPRFRGEEIAGIAPETRPYATGALIVVSLIATLVIATDELSLTDLGAVVAPIEEDVWRWFASPFLHEGAGYPFVTLVATAVFGTLVERRFGPLAPVVVFLLAGAAGSALAVAVEVPPLLEDPAVYGVLGANGAALGLLCAWLVDDRRARSRGDDRGNDLLGAYVFAAVLVLLSLAVPEANIAAAAGGAAAGALLGLVLSVFRRQTV